MKAHLRVVPQHESEEISLPPRMPTREICARVWHYCLIASIGVAGSIYVATSIALALVTAFGERRPLDVVAAGLSLAVWLFCGIAFYRRLRRPPLEMQAPLAGEVVHHFHHYESSPPR